MIKKTCNCDSSSMNQSSWDEWKRRWRAIDGFVPSVYRAALLNDRSLVPPCSDRAVRSVIVGTSGFALTTDSAALSMVMSMSVVTKTCDRP